MRAGLANYTRQENWHHAAIVASNLSELELTLGDVSGVVRDAEQAVIFADRSGDAFQRMARRTTLADALHQAGRRSDALVRFREAEAMQAESQPAYPLLYSQRGFRYCDLLLAPAERAAWLAGIAPSRAADGNAGTPGGLIEICRDVGRRAAQTLSIGQRDHVLLEIALDHLTLGCAGFYRTILEKPGALDVPGEAEVENPEREVEQAVDGLRRAGDVELIARGLFTRAWLRSLTGDAAGARADLGEAWEIAERGPMPLHQADVHLHRARLFRDRDALTEARRLIEKHGYGRRLEELADAEEASKHW